MPSFWAAWIMAGLTRVGSGGAALSGSGKTAPAASKVDALSTSRLENLLFRMAFVPNRGCVQAALVYALASIACNCPTNDSLGRAGVDDTVDAVTAYLLRAQFED